MRSKGFATACAAVALSAGALIHSACVDAAGPLSRSTPSERLARQIDRLQCHIDTFGSIVPKQPDVWGEARLTRYRTEFEYQMQQQAGTFSVKMNAAIARQDSAYFADALALQAAATGITVPSAPTPPSSQTVIGSMNADVAAAMNKADPAFGIPSMFDSTKQAITNVSLEPTIELDQRARYLHYLHELRQLSDGSESADAPGYSLRLVRIPVSIFPGKTTCSGYGAEITITAQPYLSDVLLQTTMRNLIINDVVATLGLPVTKAAENAALVDLLNQQMSHHAPDNSSADNAQAEPSDDASDRFGKTQNGKVFDKIWLAMLGGTAFEKTKRPLSPTYLQPVFGRGDVMAPVIVDANQCLQDSFDQKKLHLPDVQKFLHVELQAAFDFLNEDFRNAPITRPQVGSLWQRHCTAELATAIRELRRYQRLHAHAPQPDIYELRKRFFQEIKLWYPAAAYTTTTSLAWAIIVEAAVLNEQLAIDMNETAAAKGCGCGSPGWLPYFLPDPPPEAKAAFNEYVRCRWPIHVFALDPVTEDQNVQDAYSRRREMQLALSLAFAAGQVNAQNFMQFARRTELDMETVALNRTMVGFSHGTDTFGWRFYPRVQSPPPVGTFRAFGETLLGGPSRNRELRCNRLEPGMRDCTALVLMPSFVPYVTFDTRTTWVNLVDPRKKKEDLQTSVRLANETQNLTELVANCSQDAAMCSSVAGQHLMRAVQQLEAKLPLKSMQVQMPYENTLGGFDLFAAGVTDLSPELYGFYGEPGVDPAPGATTTVFLVGNHFSVNSTSVVAGNKAIKAVNVISRQILQIDIPGGIPLVNGEVDVHVATPNGVSNHLRISTVGGTNSSPAPLDQGGVFQWGQTSPLHAGISYTPEGRVQTFCIDESPITIQNTTSVPVFTATDAQLACWVTFKSADPNQKPIKAAIGPLACPFDDSDVPTAVFPSQNCKGVLIDAISKAMVGKVDQNGNPVGRPKITAAFQLNEIDLDGYIRFSQLDDLPVVQLTNRLTITVKEVKASDKGGAADKAGAIDEEPLPKPAPGAMLPLLLPRQ